MNKFTLHSFIWTRVVGNSHIFHKVTGLNFNAREATLWEKLPNGNHNRILAIRPELWNEIYL